MKKIRKNEIIGLTIFAIFIIGFSQINFEFADIQKENNTNEMIPKSSDSIDSTRVFIDKMTVNRGIETLNITYNNTDDFYPSSTHEFKANITFSDNSQLNLTLEDPDVDEYWSVLFTPSIYNVTGNTKITILAVLTANGEIQNTPALFDLEFSIKNNLPKIGILMNSTEIYRNETIKIDYLPSDIENKTFDLQWEVKLFDPFDELNDTLVNQGEKIFSSEIPILNSYPIGEWRIEATCWDTEIENNTSTVNRTFIVKNNEPVIENILYQIENGDPIQAEDVDVLNIFRGLDKNLTIYVNASDVESNEMKLTVSVLDPITGANILPTSYANISVAVNQTTNFTTIVNIPITANVGLTQLKMVIFDNEIIQEEYIQDIFIQNNAPILNNFTINGEFGNQTTIKEGDWLSFKFGAEDDEDSIEYVLISILYRDDFGVIKHLNYSTSYEGSNTEILIRGIDLKLKTDIYTVYAYVFDSDGDFATTAPQTFAIEPTPRVNASSWLLFVIGIIIGLTFTYVGVYSYYRKKFEDFSSTTPKEKPKEKLKGSKKMDEDSVDFEESNEKSSTKSDKKSKKKKLIRKL
ncbi:hypothetical protein DSAG12_00854 [Promethearchaeum syntrophicum]|uniref:Uncharacterized protein n=1 Tax=Promethearchaeum syntrophicum TaxID=2594042 RepID=A0A5B9D7N5_9ARCH|nr:hypothetical protein [Candidatus Prometheoarchaeum syntrophicum]QEE15031.1 hypothetical protein DSAG12_00854 [Candidatus Prometheoarchaeum syntrophicum]